MNSNSLSILNYAGGNPETLEFWHAQCLSEPQIAMIFPRQHYRIRYPKTERAVLYWKDVEIAILDLSETGACLLAATEINSVDSEDVTIVFPDGAEFPTRVRVIRAQDDKVAVTFNPCIPFARILSEQRRLRKTFRHMDS